MADKSKLNDKKASEIEKIDTTSLDLAKENLEKFKEIFPLAFSEDKLDIEKLKNFLGEKVINEYVLEKYGLNWAGKSQAFKAIRIPSTGTLVRDHKGVDEDNSENIFIEGDNLEVLKLLQKHYFNQIKMIYIDPPYNTGKDFVYKDNWTENIESYYKLTGQTDANGIKMTANTEKNGRFHSDWLTMMYSRLFLARNLLKDDGVIFVSIDDNEVANLRLIMDEIFGEENFAAQIVWQNKEGGGGSDSKLFKIKHEYSLIYAKNILSLNILGINPTNEDRYNETDEYVETRGRHLLIRLESGSLGYIKSLDYPIIAPDNSEIFPNIDGQKIKRWRWSREKLKWGLENDYVVFKKDSLGNWGVYTKQYLNADNEGHIVERKQTPLAVIDSFSTTQSSKQLSDLLNGSFFEYSKPVELIKWFLGRTDFKNNDIILDFFAGSGTTAHAVMDLNAEDGGNRKWVCVQLPELTDEKSEAYKAGYKTISEISRERIKRAGKKIMEDHQGKKDLDLGFKTFSLENSNYRRWNILTDEDTKENLLKQAKLFTEKPLVDNYKEINVVNEILLKEGFDLNSKVEKRDGIYIISEKVGDEEKRIFISFAKKVLEKDVEKLKLGENDTFVCSDSALTDTSKTNIIRRFNLKVM